MLWSAKTNQFWLALVCVQPNLGARYLNIASKVYVWAYGSVKYICTDHQANSKPLPVEPGGRQNIGTFKIRSGKGAWM